MSLASSPAKLFGLIIACLVFILSVVWFFLDQDIEPLIGVVGSIGTIAVLLKFHTARDVLRLSLATLLLVGVGLGFVYTRRTHDAVAPEQTSKEEKQPLPTTSSPTPALIGTVVAPVMTETPIPIASSPVAPASAPLSSLITEVYFRDNNCITHEWKAYTNPGRKHTEHDCWNPNFPPSYWRFNDRRLVLINQPALYNEQDISEANNELGAMIAPIPATSVMEFYITIRDLEVSSVQFGVEPRDTPGTTQATLLLFVKSHKQVDGFLALFHNEKVNPQPITFKAGDTFHVKIEMYDASMTIYINGQRLMKPIPLHSEENNLWIGYSLHPNKPANVILSNIVITR